MRTKFVSVNRGLDRDPHAVRRTTFVTHSGLDEAFLEDRARVIWRLRRIAWLTALGLVSWGVIIGSVLVVT